MKKLLFLVAFMAMTALSASAQCTRSAAAGTKPCCSKEKMGTAACPNPTGGSTASMNAAEPMVKKVAATTTTATKPACCSKDAKAAGKCAGEKAAKTAAIEATAAPVAVEAVMETAVSNNN